MCGVIGLVFGNDRGDLGRIAAELLKTLEYRGYDSTGAAIQRGSQGAEEDVWLGKGVGAPSVMVDQLGITRAEGRVFCGQVRWATFGAVTDANSQPHVVRCKTFLYGAHNGNVTNCDELKTWLTSEGHAVLSDNDGEMVVHTVEHYFAGELHALPEASRREPDARRAAMRRAILTANKKLIGSFAAVIVDPVTRTLWAIKKGSSLYFGFGATPDGERFGIASSDLSSILKLTRVLLPLSEGEMVEYDSARHTVYAVEDRTMKTPAGPRSVRAGEQLEREPVRSRLRAKDTALVPPFETFMDQEIFAQEQACRSVISLFSGGSPALRALGPALDRVTPAALAEIEAGIDAIRDLYDDAHIAQAFHALVDLPAFAGLLDAAPTTTTRAADVPSERLAERLASSEAGFLADLIGMARTPRDLAAVALMDAILERDEVREHAAAVARVIDICAEAVTHGGRLYVVCCGSSQHAAKAGCLFFNELARTELIPILPGEFRGQYAHAIDDGDVFMAVSQSGETKDLIDVMNDVIASGKRIARVSLVNNVNSTLAQEKSDVVVPLRCGPEVAVPATKSFMNRFRLRTSKKRGQNAQVPPVRPTAEPGPDRLRGHHRARDRGVPGDRGPELHPGAGAPLPVLGLHLRHPRGLAGADGWRRLLPGGGDLDVPGLGPDAGPPVHDDRGDAHLLPPLGSGDQMTRRVRRAASFLTHRVKGWSGAPDLLSPAPGPGPSQGPPTDGRGAPVVLPQDPDQAIVQQLHDGPPPPPVGIGDGDPDAGQVPPGVAHHGPHLDGARLGGGGGQVGGEVLDVERRGVLHRRWRRTKGKKAADPGSGIGGLRRLGLLGCPLGRLLLGEIGDLVPRHVFEGVDDPH
jgi:glucosamine 6-phosphate synthetase-like amidotransferase/phosphosugar isomerase protein